MTGEHEPLDDGDIMYAAVCDACGRDDVAYDLVPCRTCGDLCCGYCRETIDDLFLDMCHGCSE